MLHRDVLARAMEGADGVFHLAALWLLHATNFPTRASRSTCAVRSMSSRLRPLRESSGSFSSSASVYGDALSVPMTEEHPLNNDTLYGATKIAGAHAPLFGKPPWPSVVGAPLHERIWTATGLSRCLRGGHDANARSYRSRTRPCRDGPTGSQMFDFVFVSDVPRANVTAMESTVTGRAYNGGTGVGTSVSDLAKLLLWLTGHEDLGIEQRPAGQEFVTTRVGSAESALRDLGFRAEIDLQEGMRRLIQWRRADSARSGEPQSGASGREALSAIDSTRNA